MTQIDPQTQSLVEEAERGERAKQLLANPLLARALFVIREAIINQMQTCPLTDKDLQTMLVLSLKVHSSFEACLRNYIETGKLAKGKLLPYARNKQSRRR